jgi:hypothetical protein
MFFERGAIDGALEVLEAGFAFNSLGCRILHGIVSTGTFLCYNE